MDLGGVWRAHEADGDLAKAFSEPAYDDASWVECEIPHHWHNVPAFAGADGPLLYRRAFGCDEAPAGRRRFLELDGCFYYGDVWLDGVYLGATEGYFVQHAFEVTQQLAGADEHVLALEIASPPQRDRTAKRTVTGVFTHWDAADTSVNPGGPWRPIRIAESGPVRIAGLRLLCPETAVERSRLRCELTLDVADGPLDAVLVAVVTAPDGTTLLDTRLPLELANGENRRSWQLTVEHAPRWWPRALGEPDLCTVDVRVEVRGAVSDRRVRRTGFRDVRCDDWIVSVNGERLFLKGTNLAPTRMLLGNADDAEHRRDVELACAANLDFVRVHAHVGAPALYEAADEAGLLVWQDFPLQWGYARGVRKPALRQARAIVELLGHHPSVFLWCAHNAPAAVDRAPGESWTPGARAKLLATTVLPTWSKQVLDRSLARALHRADGTRTTTRHSGVFPGLAEPGTDTHLFDGWYHGSLHDLARHLRRWPRLGRFVSEFGAQAVPTTTQWLQPERWPALDWATLGRVHVYQRDEFERRVPPGDAKSFEEWRDETQAYQAALIQLQVEDMRRLKYAPTGGFAQFSFADPHPAISWSVLDHERVPKRGYQALRDACRPVLPMVEPRQGLVHVVNDTRDRLANAIVEVSVDGRVHRYAGDVPADSVTYVGRVDVAEAVDVEATLTQPSIGRVVNRYPLLVLRAS